MQRVAFKMQLFRGFEAEYKRRHQEIWPELTQLLQQTGITEYAIFLDEPTGILFGFMKVAGLKAMDDLPNQPVMQRWWQYMQDIMECNADASPVSIPLKEVFYLP